VISPWRVQNSSSAQSRWACRTAFEAVSASGPLRVIAAASSSAASTAPPGSLSRLTRPSSAAALGGDRVAGERHLHRHAVGDALRQAQQRAARGDQRALDLGDAELAPARGDEQVARQRDLEAARDREALDRRDERLVGGPLRDAGEAAVPRGTGSRRRRTP
jgi:hypothetical protein